jgi:hypothetical protein
VLAAAEEEEAVGIVMGGWFVVLLTIVGSSAPIACPLIEEHKNRLAHGVERTMYTLTDLLFSTQCHHFMRAVSLTRFLRKKTKHIEEISKKISRWNFDRTISPFSRTVSVYFEADLRSATLASSWTTGWT